MTRYEEGASYTRLRSLNAHEDEPAVPCDVHLFRWCLIQAASAQATSPRMDS